MPSIFISYRRQDAEVFAGRLYDRLVQEFGEDHVFMDVDTLKPGDDYLKAIERKLRRVDVFLAVIGEQWATVTGNRGSRRLEDKEISCGSRWRLRSSAAFESFRCWLEGQPCPGSRNCRPTSRASRACTPSS